MTLNKRERVIAIVAGLTLAAVVIDRLLVTPLFDRWESARVRVQQAQTALQDADTANLDLLAARRKWSRLAGRSLMSDPSQAEGQLLNKLTSYAQSAGVVTGSLQPERSEKEQGFERIAFRAELSGTMAQLAQFLFALKHADIPLRVNEVVMTPQREGVDDLRMRILVSTIYVAADAPVPTAGGRP